MTDKDIFNSKNCIKIYNRYEQKCLFNKIIPFSVFIMNLKGNIANVTKLNSLETCLESLYDFFIYGKNLKEEVVNEIKKDYHLHNTMNSFENKTIYEKMIPIFLFGIDTQNRVSLISDMTDLKNNIKEIKEILKKMKQSSIEGNVIKLFR